MVCCCSSRYVCSAYNALASSLHIIKHHMLKAPNFCMVYRARNFASSFPLLIMSPVRLASHCFWLRSGFQMTDSLQLNAAEEKLAIFASISTWTQLEWIRLAGVSFTNKLHTTPAVGSKLATNPFNRLIYSEKSAKLVEIKKITDKSHPCCGQFGGESCTALSALTLCLQSSHAATTVRARLCTPCTLVKSESSGAFVHAISEVADIVCSPTQKASEPDERYLFELEEESIDIDARKRGNETRCVARLASIGCAG